MRQVRNSTEYPDISRALATKQDVEEAIEAASAIVAACPAAAETAVGLDGNHARIAVLSTPDGRGVLELFEYIHPPASPMPPTQPNDLGMHRVAFQVDDLDAALEKAAAHGCHPLRGVADYQGVYRLTYLRGPSGIVVMLAQDMRGD